jgi:hypothetical protein
MLHKYVLARWRQADLGSLSLSARVSTPVAADNPNYPNPPGWGVSYHINGMESPVLSLTRGTAYTFRGTLTNLMRLVSVLAKSKC